MYRNRLIELASFSKEPQAIGSKLRENALSDEITDDSEDSKYSKARSLISTLNQTVLSLKKAKREYFKTAKPERQKAIHDQINDSMLTANKAMKELKPIIEQVNQQFQKQSQEGDKSKLVECNRITLQANQAIKNLNEIEEQISNQMKATLQRHAMVIQGKSLSERQVEDLIHEPQKGEQMLKEILLEEYSAELENAVSDIIDKCNDVLMLKKNMEECLSMMEDLSSLVKLQGQKLLTIEDALQGAQDHVEKGQKHLEKGKELHKKSKKKMCCIMFILLIIIGIIVIPIVITKI